MGNNGLSSKQVGSQASNRVTRRLAWIQPVCIIINAIPVLKELNALISCFKTSYFSSQFLHLSSYQTLWCGIVKKLSRKNHDFNKITGLRNNIIVIIIIVRLISPLQTEYLLSVSCPSENEFSAIFL